MPFRKGISNKYQFQINTNFKSVIGHLKLEIRNWKFKPGFTLVELLVVLGLLSITVGLTLTFLTSSLKGSNQATIVTEVKQNGQVALDLIERQVRGATDATAVSGNHLKLTRPNGDPLHIKCFNDTDLGTTVNGWIGTVVSTDADPGETTYTAITQGRVDPLDTAANQKSALITGVDVSNCSFQVTIPSTGALNPPVVNVSFSLEQGAGAPSRADFKAKTKFQTTISLRKTQ